MKLNRYFPKGIALLMALIFLYASVSKLLDLNKFKHQLEKSPLIPYGYNENVGGAVVLLELLIVYLVFKNKIRTSLLLSFALMLFFTFYIGYLLYFSYYIPCSCGGILGNLSWDAHLIFNSILTLLSGLAYLVDYEK
jgi:hypothetical protein